MRIILKRKMMLLLAFCLLLAGCNAGQTEIPFTNPNSEEHAVITIAHPFSGDNHGWFDQLFKQPLEEKYPNIQVRLTKMKDTVSYYPPDEKALELWTGELAPDLVILERSLAASFASIDLLRDITLDLKKAGISASDYYLSAWEECTLNGNSYCLPWSMDSLLLAYNKTLMKEAGLNPDLPIRTLAELDRMADLINKRNDHGAYEQVGFVPWADSDLYTAGLLHGGQWEENGQFSVNHPNNVRALEWIVNRFNSFDRVHINNFVDQKRVSFANGKNAFSFATSWVSTLDAPFEWGVAPLPTADGEPATMTSLGMGIAINKATKHPESAYKVLEFLAHEAGSRIMTKEGNNEGVFISAMPRINEELKLTEKEALAPFLEVLPQLTPRPKNITNVPIYYALYIVERRARSGDGSPGALLEELNRQLGQ